jgi:hypothetical protein
MGHMVVGPRDEIRLAELACRFHRGLRRGRVGHVKSAPDQVGWILSRDSADHGEVRGTFQVSKGSGLYPRVQVDTSACAAVGQAGGVLLVETIRTSGIDAGLSAALEPWRKPLAFHDPGKIVLDLAMSLVVGGDCLPGGPAWKAARMANSTRLM